MVKVFMTLLATKDSGHVSSLDAFAIGQLCHLDEVEVLGILKLLASPDTKRSTKQDFDGRRIKAVPGGWLVLNGEKYREMVQVEMIRARNRRSQDAWRKRQAQIKLEQMRGNQLSQEGKTVQDEADGIITSEQAAEIASTTTESAKE